MIISQNITERIEHLKFKIHTNKHVLPPCKEEEVIAFERKYGIQLPEAYRRFILEVANGGVGGYISSVVPLRAKFGFIGDDASLDQYLSRIKNEFPFKNPWFYSDWGDIPEELELFKYTYPKYMKDLVSNGSMLIANDGCGEYWNLIITGPQRGKA